MSKTPETETETETEKMWPWCVTVTLTGLAHHLYYETEEGARTAYGMVRGAMDAWALYKNDAPKVIDVPDAAGVTSIAADVTSVRLIDQYEWARRTDADTTRRSIAIERAKKAALADG